MRIPCEYYAHTLEAGNDAPLQSSRFPLPIVARREERREEAGEQGEWTNYEDIRAKKREEEKSRREKKKGNIEKRRARREERRETRKQRR